MQSNPAPLFVDTAYLHALINTRDQWHAEALRWQRRLAAERHPLITTQLILVEVGDGLAGVKFRLQAAKLIATLLHSPFVAVVPATPELVAAALYLFTRRQDKDWGMTDCSSL